MLSPLYCRGVKMNLTEDKKILKKKIVEKFKNDHNLLFRTLEQRVINHMSVFENNKDNIERLRFAFGSWKFDKLFDESRTEKFFKFDRIRDKVTYYDDLESALEEAVQNIDILAEHIAFYSHDGPYLVLEAIKAEEKRDL